MPKTDVELVRESWSWVKPADGDWTGVGVLFYDTLFEAHPELTQTIFKNTDKKEQALRLMPMIDAAVGILDSPDKLVPVLRQLGERHAGYGVEDCHYAPVGSALLATLKAGLGDKLTADHAAAWARIYGVIETEMKAGAKSPEGQKKWAEYQKRRAAKQARAAPQQQGPSMVVVAVAAVAVTLGVLYALKQRK